MAGHRFNPAKKALRRLLLPWALVALPSLLVPGMAAAQTLPPILAALSGTAPLPDAVLHKTAGAGVFLVKAGAPAPGAGAGRVVLWDEVSRTPRSTQKSVPGFSVTVNGVPQ